MQYSGQRIQIDVKYVSKNCLNKEIQEKEEKYYQYTATDEYSMQRILWASKEHSSYSSSEFARAIMEKFKYPIEYIQTDNGLEFTNRLNPYKTGRRKLF